MPTQPSDFLQPDFLDPELLKHYQSFAQQSWDAWSRQWQQPGVAAPWTHSAAPKAPMDAALDRALGNFKGYLDWLQRAATSGVAQPPAGGDWWQPLQQLFGAGSQPIVPPFAGFGSAFGGNLAQPWQGWLQAGQQGQPGAAAGFEALRGALQTPAFGYSREQQEQQQALALAMLEHQQASQQYQALMLRAQLQGAERLQQKLAERTEPGRQVESLKALYDLWVDSAEEAYAQIALSDEFREVYARQVNTQMRVKQLQFQQIEQWCREVGLPTRSEVASLGQRLQELRRELRQNRPAPRSRGGRSTPDEPAGVAELQAEIEALKEQLQASHARAAAASGRPSPGKAASAHQRKADAATPRPPEPAARKSAATGPASSTNRSSKSASSTAAPSKTSPRKRR